MMRPSFTALALVPSYAGPLVVQSNGQIIMLGIKEEEVRAYRTMARLVLCNGHLAPTDSGLASVTDRS